MPATRSTSALSILIPLALSACASAVLDDESSGGESKVCAAESLLDALGPESASTLWLTDGDTDTLLRFDMDTRAVTARYQIAEILTPWPTQTLFNDLPVAVSADGRYVAAGDGGELLGPPSVISLFATQLEDCVDRNEDGLITTSTDDQAVAWADEECRLWSVVLPDDHGVASLTFTLGELDPTSCSFAEPSLWAGTFDVDDQHGELVEFGLAGDVHTRTSVWNRSETGPLYVMPPEALALDADGGLWTVPNWPTDLVFRVDAASGERTTFPTTVDSATHAVAGDRGHVWFTGGGEGLLRWNSAANTHKSWPMANNVVALDNQGFVWTSPGELAALSKHDPLSGEVLLDFQVEPVGAVWALSVDRDGLLWATGSGGHIWVVDPVEGEQLEYHHVQHRHGGGRDQTGGSLRRLVLGGM